MQRRTQLRNNRIPLVRWRNADQKKSDFGQHCLQERPYRFPSVSQIKGEIKKIEVLGSNEKLKWKQFADSLVIEKPETISNEIAVVFKINTK